MPKNYLSFALILAVLPLCYLFLAPQILIPSIAAQEPTADDGTPDYSETEGNAELPAAELAAAENLEYLQDFRPEQTRWYRSNQLGMALEELEDPRDLDAQIWGLAVGLNLQQRLKTLYYRGQPRETWLLTYRNGKPFQQQHKKNGALRENRFFDEASGLLSEISRYGTTNGELEERRLFFYDENGSLTSSLTYKGNGELTRESTFRLDGEGRLVKLKVRRYDKPYDLVQYQLQGLETFVRQNKENKGKYLVNLFDGQRRNTSQIVYRDNVVVKRSNFEYAANGKLKRAIVTEPQRATQYDYNGAGQLTQKQVWRQGILARTEQYVYDSLGRLSEQKITLLASDSHTEERRSYRGKSSDLQKIEFYIGGRLDKIRIYSGLYAYYEELYIDGVPVAKVYYSYNDQLYSEVTFGNEDTGEWPQPEELEQTLSQAESNPK